MRITKAFSPAEDLFYAFQAALLPTIIAVWIDKTLLFRPQALSRLFMSHVWVVFGPNTDEGGREEKKRLITPNAYGVVLDVGAGHGHTIPYLDASKVTKYIAVEPNVLMHSKIRSIAHGSGLFEDNDKLLILACGADDVDEILRATNYEGVDTIISILTFCTIPQPQRVLRRLCSRALKSGGLFLFYEHVLSHRSDVAWWQKLWAPVWSRAFDGCRMDRPTHSYVRDLRDIDYSGRDSSMWKDGKTWNKAGEEEDHLFWHQVGRYVKHD